MAVRKTKNKRNNNTISKMNRTKEKAQSDTITSKNVKKGDKDSIIVRVDNETQMLLQIIKTSISSEILESIHNLEDKMSNVSNNEEIVEELKKVSKRMDNIEEAIEDLNSSINSIIPKIDAIILGEK